MKLDPATRARLVGLFVAEAEETAASLRGIVDGLAAAPDAAAVREFGRMAHGLKGAAAALGYEGLATALHDLEDLALGAEGEHRAERLRRVAHAVELLAVGTARMGASGVDAFPEDVLGELRVATAPAGERGARPRASGAAGGAAAAPTMGAGGEPPPAAEGAAPAPRGEGERLSVPAADVDAALRLASSLSRGASQLSEALQHGGGERAEAAQSLALAASSLEALVAALRLLPAEVALSGVEQEIEGLAAQLGKRVAGSVSGHDVRADRRTLQAARGMIRHLVRNAIDHGVERADARVRAGKPAEGRVSVAVDAGESTLRVVVADDGAGFDAAAIREELARRGGDAERLASLADDEVLRLWAFEGGSTRSSATEISGRGLGLSAVAQMARAAGGGIRIRSARGEGSTVEFTLPLEVYAVEALTVTAAGRSFGIPLAAVERTLHVAAAGSAIHEGPTGRTVAVGETILPLRPLAEAIGAAGGTGAERFSVVVRSEGAMAALLVDDIGAVEGIVPAAVPGVAQADALVTGLARLGSGGAVALLNPRLLVGRARAARAAARAEAPAPSPRPGGAARALDVVLAEDSLATREVLRVLLEEQGFKVRVAGDGDEALARIAEKRPDVLVTDVNMPRRDGLSLTRALRARPGTERLPIVLLTSQDDENTRAAGAAAGADAHLVKSRFNADVLREALQQIGVGPR